MLELRHLLALDAVATEGTFGAAATRLGYTQSSLSQQVAALERTVGGSLFDRPGGSRRPRITPLGRLVLTEGRAVLARHDGLLDAIERFQAGGGRIDVATFQTVTDRILPGVVRRLREEQPTCDIRLFEEETTTPRIDGLDVTFFDGDGPAGVVQTEVLRDQHVLLAAAGSGLTGPVRLADLDRQPLVALPPICDQGRVEVQLAAAGVHPDIVFRTSDNAAVVAMVRAGLGWAVMPLLAIGRERDGLDVLALQPALPDRVINALTQGTPSPTAQRFLELCLAEAAVLPTRL